MKASFRAPLFVIVIYCAILLSRLIDNKIAAAGNKYLSLIILQILIFIIPSIIFCRLRGVGYSSKLNIKPFAPGKLGCVVFASLILIAASSLIRMFEISVFDVSSFNFTMFGKYLPESPASYFLFCTMTFAVVPAITEEFVFRSIILTEYNEAGFGAVTATTVSSVLSAMIFFSLDNLPVFILCGIVCCIVTYVTGSSLTACITHFLFNVYGIFGEPYIIKAIINPSNRIIVVFTAGTLLLIILVVFFGECEHILRRVAENGVPTPSYRLKKTSDGKTPDIAATDAEDEKRKSLVVSDKARKRIEAFLSPTFVVCIFIFAVAVFGFN